MEKPSKRIWNKLTKHQKDLFQVLNYKFNADVLYPPKSRTFFYTKKEIECIAHNLALVATWTHTDENNIDLEEIRGCLARGYCIGKNKGKVVDPTLIEAQLIEIRNLFNLKRRKNT